MVALPTAEQGGAEQRGHGLWQRVGHVEHAEVLAGVVGVGQHVDDQREVDADVDAVGDAQDGLDDVEPVSVEMCASSTMPTPNSSVDPATKNFRRPVRSEILPAIQPEATRAIV